MAKYRVSYDRKICLGEFACANVAPEFWVCNKDGKADMKAAAYNSQTKRWELVIGEGDYDEMQAACESCPSNAITIEKISDEHGEGSFGDWKEDKKEEEWHDSDKPLPNFPIKG